MIMEREINLVCIGCSLLYHSSCPLSRYELPISILRVTTNIFKTNDDPSDMLESISYCNTFPRLLLPCCIIVNNTSTVHYTCRYRMNAVIESRRNSQTVNLTVVNTRLCKCSYGIAMFSLLIFCNSTHFIPFVTTVPLPPSTVYF